MNFDLATAHILALDALEEIQPTKYPQLYCQLLAVCDALQAQLDYEAERPPKVDY